jgi:hypothetical protein
MTEFFTAGSCFASLAFVALVAYAHLQRHELDRASTPLSAYFSGHTRGVMLAAYFCLSVALVCAAMKIIPEHGGIVSGVGPVSGFLMLIAAASLIPVALTARSELSADTRSVRTQSMHRKFAFVAFIAVAVAMVAYSVLGFPSDHRYQRAIRVWAVFVSLFALMAFMLLRSLPPGSRHYGLIQKILVASVATWLFISAWA